MKLKRNRASLGVELAVAAVAVLALNKSMAVQAEAAALPKVDYEFTGDIPLGAPTFNDYITFDPDGHRLYVAHVDGVKDVDVGSRTVVGAVAPLKDAHGIVVVSSLGKGYADGGDDGVVKVFNLSDNKIIKQI